MELPDDVLALVRDFSRPVTRPDWRYLHRMTSRRLHKALAERYNHTNIPAVRTLIFNYSFVYGGDDVIYKFLPMGELHLWSITHILFKN
jgi:hypothetical protein